MGFLPLLGQLEHISVQKTAILGQNQPNPRFAVCRTRKREVREIPMFLAENGTFDVFLNVPRGPGLIRPKTGDIVSRRMQIWLISPKMAVLRV